MPSTYTIEAGQEARLDVWLAKHVDHMSRARARKMVESGEVKLNGRAVKKSTRVEEGDVIAIDSDPLPTEFTPQPNPDVPMEVVYEDADLVVVHKDSGVPSHPLRPDDTHTIASALLARYPEMEGVGYRLREPGILHRLDNDTTGLLLAARNATSFENLREQLKQGLIEKRYLALVAHQIYVSTISDPISSHPSDAKRVKVWFRQQPPSNARTFHTDILNQESIGRFWLVEVEAKRATRHQIRAHLAAVGSPLVGDVLYGGESVMNLTHHFLHASAISFDHPSDGRRVSVTRELPQTLQRVIEDARGNK